MAPAPIVLVSGAPGSGKTTCARLLAERFDPSVYLESDEFFRAIAKGYVEPWRPESREQNRIVIRALARAARTYADGGYATIVDGILGPWFLDDFCSELDPAADVRYLVLRVPVDVAVERAGSRSRSPLAEAPVRRMHEQLGDLGPLEPHAVDAANAEPVDLVAGLHERLTIGGFRLPGR
ncbi:MAG TPA: AAA family ATPase [Acidimicrobiia bacterium]